MKLGMYSIYDRKTNVYHPPFLQQTDASAERAFRIILNKDSLMSTYPDDYDCVKVGTFNDDSGKVENNENSFICNGFIKVTENEN
jgi:hypothetical protein